jgi:hypothetical protein
LAVFNSAITGVRKRFDLLGLDRRFWLVVAILIIITVACNLTYLEAGIAGNLKVFMIPENQAVIAKNYIPPLGSLGNYAWNDYYSGGSFGLDPLSFRTSFWIIGQALGLQTVGIIALEKLSFQFFAFLGAFILIRYYLSKRMDDSLTITAAAFLGSLIYGLNPSYFLGDSYWVGIQLSLTSLPWIIWAFSKTALDNKWVYLPICAILMAFNVDEHFIWAGFPIILFLYMFFCITTRKGSWKKKLVTPTVAFFGVMFLFVSLIAYRLIFRLTATSSQGLALSTTGLSVPWGHATMFNMLLASSHMDLGSYYVITGNPFSFLNYLVPATILITAAAFFAVYRYSRYNEVLFYAILLVFSILFFYVDSPFKGIHEYLFFNTPIGLAFRTWRVSDALIAISLTVLCGFTFVSIIRFVKGRRFKLFGKQRRVSLIAFLVVFILLVSAYSWPLLFTNPAANAGPADVPVEFQNAWNYLDSVGEDYRAVYLPDYGSYKPVWSSTVGSNDIWTFSSSVPTILFGTNWNHFGYFALDTKYSSSLFHNQDVESLAAFCGFVNIGYLVIHNDVKELQGLVQPMISKMENSSVFLEVFHQGMVYIFKNLKADYRISTNQDLVLADGGYRLMDQFMKSTGYSNDFSYDFIGQDVSLKAISAAPIIISDKTDSQMIEGLTYMEAMVTAGSNMTTIYPYDQVVNFNPTTQWSKGSYWDPHQNVWHPYVNWPQYSFDFDFNRGVVYTIGSTDQVNFEITPDHSGNSYLILRYFANEQGGTIQVTTNGVDQIIETYDGYDGFLLAKIPMVAVDGETVTVSLKNIAGFNGISAISIVSAESYDSARTDALGLLTTKTVYKFGINVLSNPSFDYGYGGWQVYYSVNGSVPVRSPISNYTNQDNYMDGVYAILFQQNKTIAGVETYQIISDEFAIDQNKTYTITADSLPYGLTIPLVQVSYLDENNDLISQTNMTIDQRSIWNLWRSNQTSLGVPAGAVYGRVDISFDLKNNDSETWKCWLDNVRVLASDKVDLTTTMLSPKNSDISFIRISSVEYRIDMTNVSGQAIVAFRESYDQKWVLTASDGTVQGHFVDDGIINGYVVKGDGNISLTLYYTGQNNIQIGYWLSYAGMGVALLLIVGNIVWNWRKRP